MGAGERVNQASSLVVLTGVIPLSQVEVGFRGGIRIDVSRRIRQGGLLAPPNVRATPLRL
jgi:hypothetical protein